MPSPSPNSCTCLGGGYLSVGALVVVSRLLGIGPLNQTYAEHGVLLCIAAGLLLVGLAPGCADRFATVVALGGVVLATAVSATAPGVGWEVAVCAALAPVFGLVLFFAHREAQKGMAREKPQQVENDREPDPDNREGEGEDEKRHALTMGLGVSRTTDSSQPLRPVPEPSTPSQTHTVSLIYRASWAPLVSDAVIALSRRRSRGARPKLIVILLCLLLCPAIPIVVAAVGTLVGTQSERLAQCERPRNARVLAAERRAGQQRKLYWCTATPVAIPISTNAVFGSPVAFGLGLALWQIVIAVPAWGERTRRLGPDPGSHWPDVNQQLVWAAAVSEFLLVFLVGKAGEYGPNTAAAFWGLALSAGAHLGSLAIALKLTDAKGAPIYGPAPDRSASGSIQTV